MLVPPVYSILKINKRKKHTEMKRYCQTLRLKDDPELISGYREARVQGGACRRMAGDQGRDEGGRDP